jgi:hypothetical protein
MANTEGMPDDFVASLATVGEETDNRNTSGRKKKQHWLHQRMELPMGETPAAKVIRESPGNRNRGGNTMPMKDSTATTAPKLSSKGGVSMPLVGDIVEHQPNYKANNSRASSKPKSSRFAQRQLQQQPHATGFPSVHVPLGTFVKPKTTSTPKPRATVATTATVKDSMPLGAQTNVDLLGASRNDAQAMLSNMSLEEIKQAQQELQDAVSPEMLAFLRGRSKKKEATNVSMGTTSTKKTTVMAPVIKSPTSGASNDERAEKERIAKLISSVQTHEDLDAAFRAEMQQAHPLEKESDEVDGLARHQDDTTRFQMACDLLRSTSPRQTLWAARIVSTKLEELAKQSYNNISTTIPRQSLPKVLSVSLRCLLDKPVTSTYLLHTYALQSLYYLTIIYAHPAHVVFVANVDEAVKTASSIYQHYFLEDAVPMPPLDVAYPPLSVQPLSINETSPGDGTTPNTPAAYAAGSSTTSVLKDGQDFQTDPMWTLLSRMKIIPRLAYLMEIHQALMPVEAWVAICGLLCMVGQRSPGAASAIVQHETLVSCLVKRMLEQLQSGDSDDACADTEMIPYSVMTLFCSLARQSKVAAEGLPLEEVLPPVLAVNATSSAEFCTQQLALILWRTTLRYGLGLDALASMLTISARHLALPYSNKYSLSTEFLSAFSQVLECLRILRSKSMEDLIDGKISQASVAVLETAASYMASTVKLALPKSAATPDHVLNDADECEQSGLALRLRHNGAKLMYLSCWFHLFDSGGESLPLYLQDYVSPNDIESIMSALEGWTASGGDVELAWNLVSPCLKARQGDKSEVEASASIFLRGFTSLALIASQPLQGLDFSLQDVKQKVIAPCSRLILKGLEFALKSPSDLHYVADRPGTLPRVGWINQCHFSAAKLLFQAMSLGVVGSSSDVTLIRSMVYMLLARLSRGDESMAAVLFSSDSLFKTTENPVQDDPTSSSASAISSFFLGELCGSNGSREQLDHSFKLHHGFGLTSSGWGPFGLHSLTSTVDQPSAPSASKEEEEKEGQLLPLGDLWLWKTLSGSVRLRDSGSLNATKEAVDVIANVVQLILEAEEAEDVMSIQGYCSAQSTGGKLYYLMNVCLQAEEVLSDERISDSGEAILDRYLLRFSSTSTNVVDFCSHCFLHSTPLAKELNNEEVSNDTKLSDQETLEKFVESEGESSSSSHLSAKQMRSLETFIEDITKTYREYGAQFDFCTKCVRAFLLPVFPSSIRCRVLQELDGMHHLLTLPRELEDVNKMSWLLSHSVSGGLLSTGDAATDSADILNKAVEILGSNTRLIDGYMRAYCISLLARNLGSSLNSTRLHTVKHRLIKLDAMTVETICRSTAMTVQDGGTKDAIVQSVMKAISEETLHTENDFKPVVTEKFVDECLHQCSNTV